MDGSISLWFRLPTLRDYDSPAYDLTLHSVVNTRRFAFKLLTLHYFSFFSWNISIQFSFFFEVNDYVLVITTTSILS